MTVNSVPAQQNIQPISESKIDLSKNRWFIIALVTALWHVVLFFMKPDFLKPAPPAPVEVVNIDPQKLQAIQKAWKQKQLLLNTDSTPKKDITAPKDAAFESDRNRVVEKETRARQTQVIPQKGSTTLGEDAAPAPTTPDIPLKNLSNLDLGKIMNQPRPRARAAQNRPRGSTQLGGAQAILNKDIAEGEQNILNTQESIHYSFYSRIYEAIGPLWQSKVREVIPHVKPRPGEYLTRVEVILDDEGNFMEARILQSSGIRALDDAVIAAWRKVPRFPNPPRALLEKDRYVHMGWTFNLQFGDQGAPSLFAPERFY